MIESRFNELRERYLGAMLSLIDDVLIETTPLGSGLIGMNAYHFETGGKRLRALLPLLVAEYFDYNAEKLIPFGAACEMLHNATLVHDDLQDGDETRRGQETVWKKYGSSRAINLGDAMFYYALLILNRLDIASERKDKARQRLLVETIRVIDGQEREFLLKDTSKNANDLVDDYITMVEGKTSGLFALPIAGAAELVGANDTEVKALVESSRHLGVIFQIQDDVLDLYGDKGRGMVGSDIAEGKRSILVAYGLKNASDKEKARLYQIIDAPREQTDAKMIQEAIALLSNLGALDAALNEIKAREKQALANDAYEKRPALGEMISGLSALFTKPIRHLL